MEIQIIRLYSEIYLRCISLGVLYGRSIRVVAEAVNDGSFRPRFGRQLCADAKSDLL